MRKYILNDNIGLRSWRLVPYAYYVKNFREAQGLQKEEYDLLCRCDGKTLMEESPLIHSLIERGLCRPAAEKDRLSSWQQPLICDNRYLPAMNWMITGKCNYNCLHCFNAADNAPLMAEWTMNEAIKLLDEARICGINAFTITGGEPMLHPNFMDILNAIYERGMYVNEINTNGYFINQSVLDDMKKIGCQPLIKISFDGLGHHDWMRNRKGAENNALEAIKLCIANDFPVQVQTNVHKNNVDTMLQTAIHLDELGVGRIRIIRTTEAPRWLKNAGNATLSFQEYFDRMLELSEDYYKSNCQMQLDIWQFMTLFPTNKAYQMRAVECTEGQYRDSLPVCRGNRGMIAVGAEGVVYPCHQMSGYYEEHGWCLGNVKTGSLQEVLQGGDYLSEVCTTVKTLAEHNVKCRSCQYFKYCCGGCRAIGLALSGEKMGTDLSKCLFYEQGYYDKIIRVLENWVNLNPI